MLIRLMIRMIIKGLVLSEILGMDVVWVLTLLSSPLVSVTAVSITPKFNNTPEHVTVVEGGRVILPCSIEYLGEQSVIWVNPRKTLISLADRRMIDDHRISVERPYIKIWNLLIRDVRYNDSGTYECRVNTVPIQIKKVTLEVQVPPAILSQLSSDKIVLEEGHTATLICNVTGIPQPNVTWYRRNYRTVGGTKERIGLEGEVLIIHNVTRLCDDIYECFVDNGVPPAVSKAIRVVVDYPPEVVMPNPKGIGQRLGKETILECHIFAHPQAVTSWMKNGKVLTKNDKYDIEVFKNDLENSVELALRIRDLLPSDYGRYECTGSNFLGEDSESMMLYEIKVPPTTTTVATTTQTTRQRAEIVGHNGAITGLTYPDSKYPQEFGPEGHDGRSQNGGKGSAGNRKDKESMNAVSLSAVSGCLSVSLLTGWAIGLSAFLSFCPSIHPSIHPSIRPSVRPSISVMFILAKVTSGDVCPTRYHYTCVQYFNDKTIASHASEFNVREKC